MGIAHALNKVGRNAGAVSLHGTQSREWNRECRLLSKVIDASKIHREVRLQRQVVHIRSEL